MDKISGIVPSSRRVSSVDLKNAPPVRPGAPGFGRPQGISTLTEQNKPTTAERAIAAQKDQMDKRILQAKGPEFVQDMADKFFMQNKKEAGPVKDIDINVGAITASPTKTSVIEETPVTDAIFASAEEVPADEREFTPPGSYLDVVA